MKTPVVQIVHYSDLHIVGPDFYKQRRAFNAIAKRLLPASLQQGITGASIGALGAFVDFLRVVEADSDWHGKPLWLIDTGDGTTFGDSKSLESWLHDWSPQFLKAAGPHAKQLTLYGNHDAWPDTFPLLAPRAMGHQRNKLRTMWFPNSWPTAPFTAPMLRGSSSEVQLFALNSVDHDLIPNTRACGRVLPDRAGNNVQTGPTAADDLHRAVAAAAKASPGRHFRILAMHYPVAEAAQTGHRLTEILSNRDTFAHELVTPSYTAKPLVHLLLAGHTHQAYPSIGLMPNALPSASQPPLHHGFAQSVTPSLSQELVSGVNGTSDYYPDECARCFPYQCTLLRIYAEATATSTEVTVERTMVGRPSGGAFGFLPISEGSSRVSEEMVLALS
ncbi:metallophosphoesterase [Rhizobacter sp. P5_C2]